MRKNIYILVILGISNLAIAQPKVSTVNFEEFTAYVSQEFSERLANPSHFYGDDSCDVELLKRESATTLRLTVKGAIVGEFMVTENEIVTITKKGVFRIIFELKESRLTLVDYDGDGYEFIFEIAGSKDSCSSHA